VKQRGHSTTASAPGKIILFGEHAVVYGRPALAVPVNQVKAVCRIEANLPGQGIHIVAQDLGQQFKCQANLADNPFLVAIQKTLSTLALPSPPDLILTLTSTIPIARGLGSGAAISTAIVKALTKHLNQPLPPQTISDIVFEVEKIHHGTPSGIDNTVVAFAQPIFFQKGQPIERLKVGTPLTFVIGDTGIQSPTHKVVGDLRARREQDLKRYDDYFDEIMALVMEARPAIEQGNLAIIGQCMTKNHMILDRLGISSPRLNDLVEAALGAGALGAKLSGAGWGGNMIALVHPDQAESMTQVLRSAGAVQIITTELY